MWPAQGHCPHWPLPAKPGAEGWCVPGGGRPPIPRAHVLGDARAQPALVGGTRWAWGLSREPRVGQELLPGGGAGPAPCASSSPSPPHSGHPGCTEKGDAGRAEGHSCLCSEFPGRQCGPSEPRPHAPAGMALLAASRPARSLHKAHPLQVGKLRDACAKSPCWGLNSGIRSGLQDGCGRAGEGTAARLRGHPVWTLRELGRSKHRNKPRGRLPPTPSPGWALRGRRWCHLHLHLHLRTAEAEDPRDPPRLDVRLLSCKLERSWLTSSGDHEAWPGDAWG